MASDATAVEMVVLALPEGFTWLAQFEPRDVARFFSELMAALWRVGHNGDWATVLEMIEAWKETAELLADPEHITAVAEARAEYRAGLSVPAENVLAEFDHADG